jgi:hypothetical protein
MENNKKIEEPPIDKWEKKANEIIALLKGENEWEASAILKKALDLLPVRSIVS